jgi:hypothetical protein
MRVVRWVAAFACASTPAEGTRMQAAIRKVQIGKAPG